MPQQLSYGKPDTQFGVITQTLEDGGVILTVPQTALSRFGMVVIGSGHPIIGIPLAIADLVAQLLGKKIIPPRAVITLDRQRLHIAEPNVHIADRALERSWPTAEVAELRCNRYSRGLYLSVPGKDNVDLLADVPDRVVKYLGTTLEETLKQLRALSPQPVITATSPTPPAPI